MLTPQQIEEMNKITGLSSGAVQSNNRLAELKAERANQPVIKTPEKRNFMEKVAGFTGGEKIAQGFGQTLANPVIAKEREQALNDAIKQQGELLKKKKEIQELGGDTSHIDKGLEYNKQNLEEISSSMEGLLNQKGLTTKQVIGDVIQLGTTIAGAGTLPGASKAVTGATTFGKGALEGAKLGAKTGAIYGTSSGVSGALKEDKGALDIAKQGVEGALIGGASGAVLGGLTGGITGAIKDKNIRTQAKKEDFVLDLVSPEVDEKSIIEARMQRRFIEPTLTSPGKIKPDNYTKEMAKITKDIVNPKFSPQQNIDLILDRVNNTNEGVKSYVSVNKVPFNTNQLTTQLNKGKEKLNLIFASDKQAEKTYNAVVKEFIKHVKNKDTRGLLDARQEVDNIPAIRKLIESQGLGENTKKEVVKQVRTSANEYIAKLLPKDNKYRTDLLNQSKMLDASLNIATKNTGQEGRNLIQYAVKKHPWLKTAGWVGLGLLGLGGSIGAIGSATGRGE